VKKKSFHISYRIGVTQNKMSASVTTGSEASGKTFTLEELKKHNNEQSLWIAVNSKVYDLTKFIRLHPGGKAVLMQVAGTDASKQFYALHNKSVLLKYKKLQIGTLVDDKGEPQEATIPWEDELISNIPYAEMPSLRHGYAESPYMNESHVEFAKAMKQFVRDELRDEAEDGEKADEYPSIDIYKKMGSFGLLASRIGTAAMPAVKKLGISLPGGVTPDKFDPFHEMIAHQEMGQLEAPGFTDGLGAGFCIGLPPIFHFSKAPVQERVIGPVLKGEKRICLAISEPIAGSDVANIECTAHKSECGKFYIVNGVKKWITNGMFADYFVTAVRTGDPNNKKTKGMKGITMLLIEKGEGLSVKQISTSYAKSAGTALVMFDNCKVPIENLMGKENQGFRCIMANFNHERWFICAQLQGSMRKLCTDCFKWAMQRDVFGAKLIKQPVIRQKLARMIAAVEAQQASLESITWQMAKMDYFTQTMKLAGPIALLKFNATRTATMLSDEACQIYGGRAITKTGMGKGVELFQRTFKFAAILGGSEEIMADLGIRQSMAEYPPESRL